ncbi:MAG: amidohydrolase family protein [Acidobacteria bacterium]|nr:amidohydrolase family protein [Acidobacteriota bacterium]
MRRALAIFLLSLPVCAQNLAVEGETVHTMSPRGDLRNGVVVVTDGRIAQVGPAASVRVPSGYRRVAARVVTPGLIDAHTSLGLSGIYNIAADQDQDETSDPNQADLRALDGFNPTESLLHYALENGVTTIQATPGRANVIAGQAGIFQTSGEKATADSLALRPVSAMVFTLGENAKATYGPKNKAPTTRMATAALIRRALNDAQNYDRKMQLEPDKRPARDLKLEALARVVRGELPAVFSAQREDDILTAIRLGQEFSLKYMIDGAAEAYLVADEIKKAGIPVLVGPTMQRAASLDTRNTTLENTAILANKGVPIAIPSGFEGYVPKTRLVLFEAGLAAANGLRSDRALEAITVSPARILGVADRLGSIEEGKQADLVLYDGDPFEYRTRVTNVVVRGKPIR